MSSLSRLLAVATVAACASLLPAEDKKPAAPADDGFKPMFNGKNLDGWVNVNCAPGTFYAKGDEVITTGKPTGFLRTEKQYENFVLEMDWMHVNKKEVANSGLFVWGDPIPAVGTPYTRGIEVQVLINYPKVDWATNHGDIFSIWGAHCKPDRPHPKGYERCLPSEERVKGGGEWNHYKVTANNGVIKLEVNGKEVSGVSECKPRKGYLALESEGAECHFKNIKIKELPSTNPKPEECAKVDEGFISLFNGVDLKGWEMIASPGEKAPKPDWKVKDGKLIAGGNARLVSKETYARYELTLDWRVPAKSESRCWLDWGKNSVMFRPEKFLGYGLVGDNWEGGNDKVTRELLNPVKPGDWTRSTLAFDGKYLVATQNGQEVMRVESKKKPPAERIGFMPERGIEIMNVFIRELKEKK